MKKEEIYVVIDSEEKRLRAIQILSDAKEPIFSCSDIFSENPYNKCLEFFDYEWIISGYNDEDIKKKTEISLDQLEQLLSPIQEVKMELDALKLIAESYGFELVEKKREIKVGDFGKFWDKDGQNYLYGFLREIDESTVPYKSTNIFWWENFETLTDEEKQQIQENW